MTKFTERARELALRADATDDADERRLLRNQALLELDKALDAFQRKPIELAEFPEDGLAKAREGVFRWWGDRGVDAEELKRRLNEENQR